MKRKSFPDPGDRNVGRGEIVVAQCKERKKWTLSPSVNERMMIPIDNLIIHSLERERIKGNKTLLHNTYFKILLT